MLKVPLSVPHLKDCTNAVDTIMRRIENRTGRHIPSPFLALVFSNRQDFGKATRTERLN